MAVESNAGDMVRSLALMYVVSSIGRYYFMNSRLFLRTRAMVF
jgi:hypothetical protein